MHSRSTCLIHGGERIILDRCLSSLPQNFLCRYQAGFRKAHSTSHLLFLLTSAIKKSLGNKRCLPVCFLDISRAFDSVWIDGLLYKIHHAGIRGKLWHWIRAFLSNRSFFLSVDNLTSAPSVLQAGVPQGCVLSPFLFLIYINDLNERQDPRSLTLTFADDVALLPSLDSTHRPLADLLKDMQNTLDTFTSWAVFRRLSFSSTKSNLVLFYRFKTPPCHRVLSCSPPSRCPV